MTPLATREASIPLPDVELDFPLTPSHPHTPSISTSTPETDRSLGPLHHPSSGDDFEFAELALVDKQPLVKANATDRPKGKGKKRNPSKPIRKQPQQRQQRKPRTQQPVPIQRRHQQKVDGRDDQPSTSRQTKTNTPEKGSSHSRSERRSQSLSPFMIPRRHGRPHALDQPPLISIPSTEKPVTLTDWM